MAFAQARQYISRLYKRASRSSLVTQPQIDGSEAYLTEKTRRLHSISESLDLSVADQLLVQRSRQSSKSSKLKVQGEAQASEHKETLIEIEDHSDDVERTNTSISTLDIPNSYHPHPDPPISRTPKPHGLVPAKKLGPSPRAQSLRLEANISGDLAPRQPSNQSVFSDKSNTTVNHDPSKRSHNPIAVLETVLSEVNSDPFSDNNALRRPSRESSNRQSSQSTARRDNSTELVSSQDFDESEERYEIRRMVPEGSRRTSKLSRTSSDATSRRILENAGPARRDFARREFARSKAILAFNSSAPYFDLEILAPSMGGVQALNAPAPNQPGSFLHRIRTAKSTLSMRQNGSVRQKLRRMKTMAILTTQYRPGCLKGKSLEDLSRLGGESILSRLPPRYFPGALKLPTCIAATVSALLNYGTAVPFIHSKLGNHELASALYSYYAGQVLGAEKLKERINKTMRPIDLPLEQMNVRAPGRADEHVHVISSVLKQFLAEIPGGILGSMRLYSILKKIYDSDFSHLKSLHDPGKKDYLPDIASTSAAKVRMIALAMMALTTDAQLELICAIFGLLAVTADESRVMKDFHYIHLHPKSECDRCEGLTDSVQLGGEFGHLVCGFEDVESKLEYKTGPETRAAEVTTMLIDVWKDISRQFCMWELISS